MANTKSAKKAARQMVRRTEVNKSRRTRVKSEVRKVEEAIAAGNKSAAAEALKAAEPIMAAIKTSPGTVGKWNTPPARIARATSRPIR